MMNFKDFAKLENKSAERPRFALALSGGGIRSATFALGVMQFLALRGLLSKLAVQQAMSRVKVEDRREGGRICPKCGCVGE